MSEQTYAEKRQQAYSEAVTMTDLLEALWEKVVENRPEKALAMQAIREEIKVQHPKS